MAQRSFFPCVTCVCVACLTNTQNLGCENEERLVHAHMWLAHLCFCSRMTCAFMQFLVTTRELYTEQGVRVKFLFRLCVCVCVPLSLSPAPPPRLSIPSLVVLLLCWRSSVILSSVLPSVLLASSYLSSNNYVCVCVFNLVFLHRQIKHGTHNESWFAYFCRQCCPHLSSPSVYIFDRSSPHCWQRLRFSSCKYTHSSTRTHTHTPT